MRTGSAVLSWELVRHAASRSPPKLQDPSVRPLGAPRDRGSSRLEMRSPESCSWLSEVSRRRVTALRVSSLMSSCQTPATASGLAPPLPHEAWEVGQPPPPMVGTRPGSLGCLFSRPLPSRAQGRLQTWQVTLPLH